jgi:hypothetical protein
MCGSTRTRLVEEFQQFWGPIHAEQFVMVKTMVALIYGGNGKQEQP